MKRFRSVSLAKLNEGTLCEDSSMSTPSLVAVSDGAGGGGLFSERWSKYLLDNLPDIPFESAEQLDFWVGSIWEPFYEICETDAKRMNGMSLRKFYEEGSYATLAAAWLENGVAKWITYGDSVVFHYRTSSDELEWSPMNLLKFNEAPFLIGTTSKLSPQGFNKGLFHLSSDSVVFVASDALSHFIIMMYEIRHYLSYESDLLQAMDTRLKNYNVVLTAKTSYSARYKNHIMKIISSSGNRANFARHLTALLRRGVIWNDDYSLAYAFPERSING